MSNGTLTVRAPSGSELVVAVMRAAVGSVPIVGPAATELVNLFFRPASEERGKEWAEQILAALEQIRARGNVDLAALGKDQAFVDVVAQATHIAMRNYQQEKREALRNAIANSAGPQAPEESKRQMFLQFIDRFTVWHLKLLRFFAEPPTNTFNENNVSQIIETSFSELRGKKEFYQQIWNDLRVAGVVLPSPQLGIATVQPPGPIKQTTSFGDEFLAFINQ
jgi:hypothetical protein